MILNKPCWMIIALVGLVTFSVGCQTSSAAVKFKGVVSDPPPPAPDFELMAADGRPFHLSDNQGDITLIYFGYTYCPDVCPLTLWEIKNALARLKSGRERVHVLFISVDPDRDKPELLAKYVAAFGPEFVGLTDDFEKTQAVMAKYGAVAEIEEVPNSAAGYLVSHSATLYLIDTQGNLLLQYPFGFEAEELHSDLAYLLAQEKL